MKKEKVTLIDIKGLVKEFQDFIKNSKKLEAEYEKYIKNYGKVKSQEVIIKVLETKNKLAKLKADIEAKENYIEYFIEHSHRNIDEEKK